MNAFFSWLGNLPWSDIWPAVSAIATSVAALAIFFAVRQLRFDAWLKAQNIFVNDEFRDSRCTVFSYLEPRMGDHGPENRENFALVCQLMDELCNLRRYLGISKMLRSWDDPIGKAWFVLKKWVEKEREIAKWPTKWRAFERVGRRAVKRIERRYRKLSRQDGNQYGLELIKEKEFPC